MKRVLSLFLSCIFVLGVCFSTPIVASATDGENQTENEVTFESAGYTYKQLTAPDTEDSAKGTCALVKYTGGADYVVIPIDVTDETGNYTLTEIEDDAFANCTNLKYVKFAALKEAVDETLVEKIPENITIHYLDCSVVKYKSSDETITFYCNCNDDENTNYACGDITLVGEDSLVYDGTAKEVTPKVSGNISIYDSETMKVLYNGDETKPTNVGTYTAKLTLVEAAEEGNGEVSATTTFKIEPKTIIAKLDIPENGFTYNGEAYEPTVKFTDTAEPSNDAVLTVGEENDYTVTYTNNVNAGTATVTVTLKDEGNYTFGVENEEQVYEKALNYTVNKKDLNINITTDVLYTTNDLTDLEYTFEGLVGGDTIESITFKTDREIQGPDAYQVTIDTIVIKNNETDVTANYNVTCNKNITVKECNHSPAEGKEATCQNKAVCATCDKEYGEVANHSWVFVANEMTITATCQTDGCDFSETSATITLKKNNDVSFVYDGTVKENPVEIEYSEGAMTALGDILTGVSVVYAYDGQSCTVKNAGEKYSASVTLGEQTATLPFEITAKELTDNDVTITGIEDSYEYTGKEIKPSVDVSNGNVTLVKDTDYTVEYSNNTEVSTESNPATVTVTFKGNYSGTVVKTFEIVAQHVHSWTFDVVEDENENKISATCTDSNCIYYETGEIFSLIINSNENLVYDNNVKTNPINIVWSANAQNVFGEEFLRNLTVSYSGTVKNAGTYTATLVMGEGENVATITKIFTVSQKTITATLVIPEEGFTYNGAEHKPTVEFTGAEETLFEGESADYTVEYTGNVNAGTATAKVTLKFNGNYTFGETEGQQVYEKELSYTIGKKLISSIIVSVADDDYKYIGSAIEPNVTVKINGEETALAAKEYAVEYRNNVDAGTGTVTVTLSDNYDDTGNTEDLTVTFTINKATPDDEKFTFTPPANLTYDGEAKTATVVVKDGVTGMGAVTLNYYKVLENDKTESLDSAPAEVGDYIVKIDVDSGNNYDEANDITSDSWKFTLEKAQVVITAPTINNLTYTGSAQALLATAGSATFGEIEYSLDNENWIKTIPTATEKGKYTVYYRVQGTENYVGANGSVEVTIEEHKHDWQYSASGAVITATCQNAGCDVKDEIKLEINTPTSDYLVYNGEAKQVTYTITEGYEELFKEATISYKGDCVDAGNYTAYVEIGDATARLNFEISKAVIVVTKVTATNRVYDGTLAVEIDKDADIESTGLVSGDKVSFDLSALKGTLADANAGENKVVTITGSIVLTGEDAENYLVSTPKTTTVNITPATLTVTPNAKSSEQYYSLPALDYKVTGFIGSDKLTKEPTLTTNADIKKVGNYTITATGAEASANYTITYAPATLTITEHKNHIVKDGTWKETVHGTCMVAGKEAGTCTLCSGTVTRDSKTDPNNHALITTVTKLQTCTQNGEALVTCANGCKYSLKTAVPADGKNHDFAEDFTVIASTCVAKGSKYKVCQNPGCKVVSEKTEIAINPDAHKNIVTVNAKDATCETKGYTGDKVCNDCKKITDPGMEINAKGHTESDWIIDKEPTFTEEGAKHTACTVCKKELKKEVIAKRALEVPKVKIENVSNGIKVSWSQDEDATGYTVYSSTYNASTKKWSSWKNRGTAAATKSSWTDKTVTEGVTYRYTVRSVNGDRKSAYKATSGLLYVVAPKVTVSITSTGLLAKWNKVSNATSYIVYRAELGADGKWGKWVQLGTTQAEKNTWSDTNTQSGVTYRYTVRAVVGKVKSGYTASSSIIYLAQPVLKIENVSNGIQGKWSPIAGATGYTIYRSEYNTSTGKWSKWLTLGTTGATAKTFTDKTVKSGYKYKYTIRAVNGNLKSTYQASNKLVYLAQPTLKISNVANGIQGKWNQVNGATGYIIYRSELIDGKWTKWVTLGTAKATAKTFTDKTVKSGVKYRYTIRAKNGGSKSSYVASNQSVFLSVPTVKISSGITGVNVSWSKIEGATSYLVYRREYGNGKWSKWSEIKTVTETSFVDETAKSGTGYRYTVRALNGSSKSTYTSTKTLNYLAAPTVKLEKLSDSIKVNWTQVTGVTGYTIYRAELGADGKWSKWVTLGTATDKYSSCKDKTAKAGVTYKYTVRAVNGKVKSAYIDGTQITNQ